MSETSDSQHTGSSNPGIQALGPRVLTSTVQGQFILDRSVGYA